MNRVINKLKYKNNRVEIGYALMRDDGKEDVYAFSCQDAPKPSMQEALNALRLHMIQWLVLPEEVCESMEITSVSITWKDGIMGACVTAQYPCSAQSPLVLNAPHKPEFPYSASVDDAVCLTAEQADAIRAVIAEANAYLDGDRAQMQLDMSCDEACDAIARADVEESTRMLEEGVLA